jgi:cytochrome b
MVFSRTETLPSLRPPRQTPTRSFVDGASLSPARHGAPRLHMSGAHTKVWDIWVRLFHWALVVLVAEQIATGELGWLNAHIAGGCTLLGLLLFRLAWGFAGSDTARFAGFVRSPAAALRQLAHFRSAAETTVGHTPAGGWSVLAMLALLCMQVATGLFADDDVATTGPLGQFVSRATRRQLTGVHVRLFWVLLILIALHVAAVAAYRLVKRKNLVRPMITGWTDDAPPDQPAPRMGRLWVALLIAAASGAAAWKIWSLADTL